MNTEQASNVRSIFGTESWSVFHLLHQYMSDGFSSIITLLHATNQSINNKFADSAMVRHSSDEPEAPEMAADYSKATEKRCILRRREKRWSEFADQTVVGRLFQVLAAAMVNARSDVLVVVVGFDNRLITGKWSQWTGWCVIMQQIVQTDGGAVSWMWVLQHCRYFQLAITQASVRGNFTALGYSNSKY